MRELTKGEKKQVKELLRKGILRRHAQWQSELRELLDKPFDDEIGNEFDRSMLITDKVRKFYKEAMQIIGLLNLLHDGYLTGEDIAGLPDDLKERFENF